MFPGDTPQHKYLRALAEAMLASPEGVAGGDMPYSVEWSAVNCGTGDKGHAVCAYKQATGQLPSALVNQYSGHFVKRPHTKYAYILTLTPRALSYVLGHTDDLPGTVARRNYNQLAVAYVLGQLTSAVLPSCQLVCISKVWPVVACSSATCTGGHGKHRQHERLCLTRQRQYSRPAGHCAGQGGRPAACARTHNPCSWCSSASICCTS
jgi:hypothetical protein